MIHRIKTLKTLPNYMLEIQFDDGRTVTYDVKEDIEKIPSYVDLKRIEGLFNQVQIDESRTCISWNANIDLPSDILYEYGNEIKSASSVAEQANDYNP